MKSLYSIILLIAYSFSAIAQDSLYQYFKLEPDYSIVFEKVYEVDSLDKYALANHIINFLSQQKGISNVQQNNQIITAEVRNNKAYNIHTISKNILLNLPFDYNATIQVKDGKYKVTLKDFNYLTMETTKEGTNILTNKLEYMVINRKTKDFSTKNKLVFNMKEFEDYLAKYFMLKINSEDW